MGEGWRTILRIALCAVVLWSLQIGSYSVPITLGAAVLVATMLTVLTAYELAIRDVAPERVGAMAVTIMASIMGSYFVWHALQPPPPTGPLRPANEPAPKLACAVKPVSGDLVIMFGTDARIGEGKGPFTAFRTGDCPVLSFTRTARGLSFSHIGYDYDGDIAFMIRDGIYNPLLPLALRAIRPDPSTYILLDHYDQEVLYIRYLNRDTVRVRGRFICGEAPQVVVRDDAILLGGIRIAGVTRGQHVAPGPVCLKAGAQTLPPLFRKRR